MNKNFVYLSDLFYQEDVLEDSLIKVNNNDDEISYEEEYNPGVINTDIIPIKYYGNLSRQMALFIKKQFEEIPERYKFFLQSYSEIVISTDTTYIDKNALLLDNYNKLINYSNWNILGFFIGKFANAGEKLLNGLEIDCEEILEATYPISSFYLYENDYDLLYLYVQVIALCLDNKYFKELDMLLNSDQEDEDLFKTLNYIKKEKQYTWLNSLLSEKVNPFFKKYFHLFSDAFNYLENYRDSNYLEFINFYEAINSQNNFSFICKDSTFISKEKMIFILRKFFSEIDKSQRLFDFFNTNLENNSIILLEKDDILSDKFINNPFINEGAHFSISDKYVYVPLNNNINDLFLTVHEVMHYYFNNNYTIDSFNDKPYLEEFPSIYIEKVLEDFLIRNGFDEENIKDFYNQRILFTAGNNYLMVAALKKLLDVKDICNTIDEDNIYLCEEALKSIKKLGKDIQIDKKWHNPVCMRDYEDICDGSINNILYFQNDILGYILGVYFTSSLEIDYETTNIILNFKNIKDKEDYDDQVISIVTSHIKKQEDNKKLKKGQ